MCGVRGSGPVQGPVLRNALPFTTVERVSRGRGRAPPDVRQPLPNIRVQPTSVAGCGCPPTTTRGVVGAPRQDLTAVDRNKPGKVDLAAHNPQAIRPVSPLLGSAAPNVLIKLPFRRKEELGNKGPSWQYSPQGKSVSVGPTSQRWQPPRRIRHLQGKSPIHVFVPLLPCLHLEPPSYSCPALHQADKHAPDIFECSGEPLPGRPLRLIARDTPEAWGCDWHSVAWCMPTLGEC